jgi:transposase
LESHFAVLSEIYSSGTGSSKYPSGRESGTLRYILHFDNAPLHSREEVEQTLQECEILRLEDPPYSPYLSPCHFFFLAVFMRK